MAPGESAHPFGEPTEQRGERAGHGCEFVLRRFTSRVTFPIGPERAGLLRGLAEFANFLKTISSGRVAVHPRPKEDLNR